MPKKTYGGRGQDWHPEFIDYVTFIASHPVYDGMPDAFTEDGLVQWEAPSNRTSGRFKDTHIRRKEWWKRKALNIGIDPSASHWISHTAKTIHPTGQKPCKNCGNWMEIRYAYPSQNLIKRIQKLDFIPSDYEIIATEHILDLVVRLYDDFEATALSHLPMLLKTRRTPTPSSLDGLESWLEWIDKTYIPQEPSLLSPGAMSNAPDRFDGFHSFNLCCRSSADKGRHRSNLASYTTDRRVFEHWNEGNWIAADRLMGKIRTLNIFRDELCRNGHVGPCSADHIGPLSLGFCHRPEFQLLCNSCNSAKNNRMSYGDIEILRDAEARGEQVVSWYAESIWSRLKSQVHNDETALRLSKVMRDNRHNAMLTLSHIADEGFYLFLTDLLELAYAEYDVEFQNLRVERHITYYDQLILHSRDTKYVAEQKARRIRVAFESLSEYASKENRNALSISTPKLDANLAQALHILGESQEDYRMWDKIIQNILNEASGEDADVGLRTVVTDIPTDVPVEYDKAKAYLKTVMEEVAIHLTGMWNNDRYIRL